MKKYWMRKAPFFILMIAAGIFLFGWVVMLLWNAILPALLNVNAISFWQAVGLLVLSKILFGGFRGGWKGKQHMRQHWQNKWTNMSEDDKIKFKEKWGKCFAERMEKKES